MSANNFILIQEKTKNIYEVSEKDYEGGGEIQNIGTFDLLRIAVEKAEKHISDSEMGIEYGIRFSFMKHKKDGIANDFDKWNEIKKKVDAREIGPKPFPKYGEVWMCILGKNIGREQNGGGQNYSRPALVIKKFNNEIFWILPLSTKQKDIDFYYNFTDINNEKVSVILSQIRLIHIKRFERNIYEMNLNNLKEIKRKLQEYIT